MNISPKIIKNLILITLIKSSESEIFSGCIKICMNQFYKLKIILNYYSIIIYYNKNNYV